MCKLSTYTCKNQKYSSLVTHQSRKKRKILTFTDIYKIMMVGAICASSHLQELFLVCVTVQKVPHNAHGSQSLVLAAYKNGRIESFD